MSRKVLSHDYLMNRRGVVLVLCCETGPYQKGILESGTLTAYSG